MKSRDLSRRLLAQHIADTTPPKRGGNAIQAAFLLVWVVLSVGIGVAAAVRSCGGEGVRGHRRPSPAGAWRAGR